MSLTNVEAFLAHLTEKYMVCAGLSQEKLAVEIPAAFARTARAVLLTKMLSFGRSCQAYERRRG